MEGSFLRNIKELGVIPVISIDDATNAEYLGTTLLEAGLPCAEVTYRTAEATEAIRVLSRMSEDLIVGAGTVLSVEKAQEAVEAGARFIVSPGFDPIVVDWCKERGIAMIPGVATPSEIIQVLNRGLRIMKLFPAEELGGIKYLKALTAVFQQAEFVPTGGISAANLAAYLQLPGVFACGGSWIAERKLIASKAWEEIKRRASYAVDIVRKARSEETL